MKPLFTMTAIGLALSAFLALPAAAANEPHATAQAEPAKSAQQEAHKKPAPHSAKEKHNHMEEKTGIHMSMPEPAASHDMPESGATPKRPKDRHDHTKDRH